MNVPGQGSKITVTIRHQINSWIGNLKNYHLRNIDLLELNYKRF